MGETGYREFRTYIDVGCIDVAFTEVVQAIENLETLLFRPNVSVRNTSDTHGAIADGLYQTFHISYLMQANDVCLLTSHGSLTDFGGRKSVGHDGAAVLRWQSVSLRRYIRFCTACGGVEVCGGRVEERGGDV